MADDITLTVRVRDLTRGDFERVNQRLREMDGRVQHVGQSSNLSAERTNRFSESIRSVSERLTQLSHTGNVASADMAHMRGSMSLLNRNLMQAARSGELTRTEFRQLSRQLGEVRLDFDHLNNDIVRHDALVQASVRTQERAARAQAARAREAARAAASEEAQQRTVVRAHAQALREQDRMDRARSSRTITTRIRDTTSAGFERADASFRRFESRINTFSHRPHFQSLERSVSILSGGFIRVGEDTGRVIRGFEHVVGGARRVTEATGRATDQLIRFSGAGLRRAANSMSSFARRSPLVAAGLTLLGSVAQLAGAALTVVLGGAFVALGAYALKGSAQVKSAFQDMKTTVVSTVREAAAPLVPFLVEGMHQVATAARFMGPLLREAFTATGPLVNDLFGAVTGLARAALPGMVSALQSMGPIMAGFRTALTLVGEVVSNLYTLMTSNGAAEGLGQVWRTVGNELKTALDVIGKSIGDMANSGAATLALIGVFRALDAAIILVTGVFQTLDTITFGAFKHLTDWITGVKNIAGVGDTSAKSLGSLQKQLAAVNAEIAKQQAASPDKKKTVVEWDPLSGGQKTKQIGQYDDYHGPSKDAVIKASGFSQSKLNGLLSKRVSLEGQVAQAASDAAAKTSAETKSVQQFVDAMRALNAQNQSVLDTQSALEQSIDDAAKAAKKMGHALKFNGNQIDLTSQASRDAYTKLSDLATKTNAATKAVEDGKGPWKNVISVWKEGHDAVYKMAREMGASKEQAKSLADQITKMPNKKAVLKVNYDDLMAKLNAAKAKLKTLPKSKQAKLQAQISDLENKVAQANRLLNALDGKTAVTYIISKTKTTSGTVYHESGNYASGGYITGPGSGTSDDIPARLSNGEFVVNSSSTRRNRRLLEAINAGHVRQFAKGGLSSGAKSARSEAASQFGVSYFGHLAGYKTDSFGQSLSAASTVKDLVASLNKWRSLIKAATSGGAEKNLLSRLSSAGKSLIKYEKQQVKVNAALDKAKDKLSSLKDAAASLADSVKSGIMSGGSITNAAGGDSYTSLTKVMDTLHDSRDKAVALAGALKTLKARGLNGQSLSEIASAGVDGGGLETASALLSGKDSDIKLANSLQKQIAVAGKSAGKTTADAMYAGGMKAAEGLIKGLEKQKKHLEKLMETIAKSLEKDIKKAFGIKGKSSGGAKRVDVYFHFTGGDKDMVNLIRKSVRVRGGNVQAVFGR